MAGLATDSAEDAGTGTLHSVVISPSFSSAPRDQEPGQCLVSTFWAVLTLDYSNCDIKGASPLLSFQAGASLPESNGQSRSIYLDFAENIKDVLDSLTQVANTRLTD